MAKQRTQFLCNSCGSVHPKWMGKCPDCGRVVPVPSPAHAGAHPEADTTELSPEQRIALDQWAARFPNRPPGADRPPPDDDTPISIAPPHAATARAEAGLRVCPNCKRPIHLGADTCRACGTAVPRKA